MNIDRNLIGCLRGFLESRYGVVLEDSAGRDEVCRGMYNDCVVIIRERFPRRTADSAEVFCRNAAWLERAEKEFYVELSAAFEETEQESEHDEETE